MRLIEQLRLSPHPEGGHFRETYRASQFVLSAGERSHWHRLHSDEAWHFHGDGSPWSLVSCTVAPGFDFADFELAAPDQLDAHDAALTQLCGD